MTTAFGTSTYCYRHVARLPPRVEVFTRSPAVRVGLPNRTRISSPRSSPQPCLPPSPLPAYPTTDALRDQVGLFLRNIDATLSPGLLSFQILHQPFEVVLKHVSPDQYQTIRHLVDVELPGTGCSAAKLSKLDYYADGTLIVTFPTQVHEILTGIIEHIRDQMWEQGFYWKAWSDKKDRIMLSKSISISNLNLNLMCPSDTDYLQLSHSNTKTKSTASCQTAPCCFMDLRFRSWFARWPSLKH